MELRHAVKRLYKTVSLLGIVILKFFQPRVISDGSDYFAEVLTFESKNEKYSHLHSVF